MILMKRMIKLLLLLVFLSFPAIKSNSQSLKDVDGNVYASTTIGKQEWMAENLKTTKYNDGTPIPYVESTKAWAALKAPGYCWYNNKPENKEIYGALYNWYTVNTNKLCPTGWHVPSQAELTNLITFIGDQNLAGDKLKEVGTDHWISTLTVVTNPYDFTALPGGFRLYSGSYSNEGEYGVWWTSTVFGATQAWNYGLYFHSTKLYNGHDISQAGFSVRCIKNK